MPDPVHGKTVFGGLVEYPLPQVSGVRDYIFYFVPNTKGYGKEARLFFNAFYGQYHVHEECNSLEQLIGALFNDVTHGGVQQIRELVIVSHGSANGLLIPLVANPTDPNMKFTTAYSLMQLQQKLAASWPTFDQQRTAVISHLHPDSWVTIRACNFGQSEQAMYALYSFFGGNADLYAPMKYQFFGTVPIADGMRYTTHLQVHEHLVKQRLQPKDVHTPDRQDAVVRALVNPAAFSEPFTLATTTLGQPEPADYSALVNALNASHGTTALQTLFQQNGFSLTSNASFSVVEQDAAWRINDLLTHPGGPYPVQYSLNVETELATGISTLTAQAQLIGFHSAGEHISIQLFLADGENNLYQGKLFNLAYTADDDQADAANKTTYDTTLALLPTTASAVPVPAGLAAGFDKNGYTLADHAAISQTSSTTTPPDTLARVTWTIGPAANGDSFLIKLAHPYGPDSVRAHALNVFKNLGELAMAQYQDTVISHVGTDLDGPGTELPAFMDRLSIDDLLDVVAHLRDPYVAKNAIYIWHAQQAIVRKGGYAQWVTSQITPASSPLWPEGEPTLTLSSSELDDKAAAAYGFEFQGNWAEVKASNRSPTSFTTDLWSQESLATRFGINPATLALITVDENSPYTSADELRKLESLGLDQFFSSEDDKSTFVRPTPPAPISCDDFRKALQQFKNLSNSPVDQLANALRSQKTADSTSYLSILLDLKSKYSFLRNMLKLTELNDYLNLPKIPIPTDKYELTKFAVKWLAKAGKWELLGNLVKIVGEIDFVYTIPLKMWFHIIDEQQAGAEKTEAAGRLTALRRWLRFLVELTYATHPNLPDDLTIDVTVSRTGKAYYLEAYDEEMSEGEGMGGPSIARFIYYDEDFKKGFDAGAANLGGVWPVLLRATKQAMSDLWLADNLTSCHVQALIDAGYLDEDTLRATIVRAFAEQLLNEVPHV
jgi:hypothetical protein